MASEDVIELGSSDDDAEPVPKKRKPTPNAMVHIPSQLTGVTIKPAKTVSSLASKGVLAKPIIIQKANQINPTLNRIRLNSGTIRVPIGNKNLGKDCKSISPFQKVSINPLSIANSLSKTQVVVKKVSSSKKLKNPVEIQGSKLFNNLPPSITIKPLYNADITIRPVHKAGASGINIKKLLNVVKKKPKEMLTVEIDDEDATESATASPQWYLRPEQQIENNDVKDEGNDEANMEIDSIEPSMEEKNNKEPQTTNFVEITIEDSPIKPLSSKHPDIGKELTITIEDSPVKPVAKLTYEANSDDDINEIIENRCPQSKKKLDYPKETNNHVVEIEIDLKDSDCIDENEKMNNLESLIQKVSEESEQSPKRKIEEENINISKKDTSAEANIQAKDINTANDEFHPTYQKFICMCFELENTEDMKKIVDKKIKAYYKQCPKEYVESEEFIDMVSSKIVSMKAAPAKMYLYIKDIVDELNLQRKMTKTIISNKVDEDKVSSNEKYVEPQYDSKKKRQIRKLEKTIKKLHRAIQKLEEQEVDFDDDEDSVYLLTERYKERMVRVHAKFCQLTNTKMPSEPRIHIEARPGRPAGPAKKLEKWINRKVPIGTPLPFPDFHDVLRCVREANEEEKLGWGDIDVMDEARDLFTRCGKKLQRRRQENEWRIAVSRISAEVDPAENSLDLKQKLDENKTVAAKKETELLNKYADRQNDLKLEGEEIGDKEAEESPVESEEEEEIVEDDKGLEEKAKRKQRIKSLLKEKSKKEDDKENDVKIVPVEKENIKETKEVFKDKVQEEANKELIEDKSYNMEIVEESVSKNETGTSNDKMVERDSATDQNYNESSDTDISKVESDIDELHLLQKKHSENEANTSTQESSDSDSPIAISDTLDSDSEVDNDTKSCDIISIENSSYSESESNNDGLLKDNDTYSINKEKVERLVNTNSEIEYSSIGIEQTHKEIRKKEAITQDVEENILLASSDEEDKDKGENLNIEHTCINLRDDNISISETIVDGGTVEDNVSNDENSIPENNNAVEIVEVSPESEENDVTLDMTQNNSEDTENHCKNISQEFTKTEEDTNENDSPQEVDIRSISDVNSQESIDLHTANENKIEHITKNSESMNVTESIGNELSDANENVTESSTKQKAAAAVETANNLSKNETTCEMSMEI